MKTLKIQIPNMQSTHCQTRVTNALQETSGVKILKIQAGIAEVELQNPDLQKAVVTSIEKAGYTVTGVQTDSIVSSEDGNTFQFKTNINCSGCVAKVTNELDEEKGIDDWEVDTVSKDKILTIHSGGISKEEVMKAVQKAGFKIESI